MICCDVNVACRESRRRQTKVLQLPFQQVELGGPISSHHICRGVGVAPCSLLLVWQMLHRRQDRPCLQSYDFLLPHSSHALHIQTSWTKTRHDRRNGELWT